MTNREKSDIARKLRVLNHVNESGNISRTCRYFGISREAYYQWKRAYEKEGEKGLVNSKLVLPRLNKHYATITLY